LRSHPFLVIDPGAELVVLIKPQFEAGRSQVGTGGVVKDPKVHQDVIQKVTSGIEAWGFRSKGVCESPIKGEKSGNTEFLSYFIRDPSMPLTMAATIYARGQDCDDSGGDVTIMHP